MKKILLILIFGLLPFLMAHQPLFANTSNSNQNNLNSQNFMVDVNAFDPLGGTHGSSGKDVRGTKAFSTFIGKITDMLLMAIPILAGISLLIAGYFYIFSAGDSEKAGRAKTIIKWNIIAIFISILSYAIIKTVASFFSNLP